MQAFDLARTSSWLADWWPGWSTFTVTSTAYEPNTPAVTTSSESAVRPSGGVVACFLTCDGKYALSDDQQTCIESVLAAQGHQVVGVVDVRPAGAPVTVTQGNLAGARREFSHALDVAVREFGGGTGLLGGVAVVSAMPAAANYEFGSLLRENVHGDVWTFERPPPRSRGGTALELAFQSHPSPECGKGACEVFPPCCPADECEVGAC
jgi:hypothetical protein